MVQFCTNVLSFYLTKRDPQVSLFLKHHKHHNPHHIIWAISVILLLTRIWYAFPSLLIQNWNFLYESKPIIFIDEVWIFFYRVVFKVFAFPSIISPTVAILAPNGQTFLNIIHVPFIIVTFIRDGLRYSKIEFWVVVHKIIPRIGWKRHVDQ